MDLGSLMGLISVIRTGESSFSLSLWPITASSNLSVLSTTTPSPSTNPNDISAVTVRYRPSLEFRGSVTPVQSTALVPYGQKTFAENTAAHNSDSGINAARERTRKAPSLQSRLQSLVNFAREANASEQAALPLKTFMQQAKDQREIMEAVLEKQIAAAAASFAAILLAQVSQDTDQALKSSHDTHTNSSPEYCLIKPMLTSPDVSRETYRGDDLSNTLLLPSPKLVATFQSQERPRAIQQDEEAHIVYENVARIREETQRTYRAFAGTSSRTEKAHSMELALQPVLTPSSSIQPQQTFLQRTLGTRLELIGDANLDVLSFRAKGGLTRIISSELRDIAALTKTRGLYGIEMQLHPYRIGLIGPENEPRTQVSLEHKGTHDNKMQRRLAEQKTVVADAGTQTLLILSIPCNQKLSAVGVAEVNNACKTCKSVMSDSLLTEEVEAHLPSTSPALPTDLTATTFSASLTFADSEKRAATIKFNPSALKAASKVKAAPQAVDSHSIGKQKSNDDLKDVTKPKEEALKVPVKETIRLARKKEQNAINGPDHFLSLLDLTRKKWALLYS